MEKPCEKRLCCIFNLAALYRGPIYTLMDENLECDFYITKWEKPPFKEMDYSSLKGYKESGRKITLFKGFYWQTKTIGLIFKPYNKYILTGEPFSLSTWVILLLGKVMGKEIYLWSHGWYGRESKLKSILKYWFFKLAKKVLLYGDYARDLMIKEGLNADKLLCIYNSLDYENQIEVRKTLQKTSIYTDYFKNDFPVLLYVGRIQKIKKIDLILYALKELRLKGHDCNLIIIGSDKEGVNLEKKVKELNLEKYLWFYGACYSEEKLGELIFNASVCVSPGNVGLTAMHSLVYGTPVITHNNFKNQMPEFEAIEDNVSGGFFEENSLDDLYQKIKIWTSMTSSEREITRENCYKIIDTKYNPFFQLEILKKIIK